MNIYENLDDRFERCGVCEIERRPRGASQHKAAPTSVSGQ